MNVQVPCYSSYYPSGRLCIKWFGYCSPNIHTHNQDKSYSLSYNLNCRESPLNSPYLRGEVQLYPEFDVIQTIFAGNLVVGETTWKGILGIVGGAADYEQLADSFLRFSCSCCSTTSIGSDQSSANDFMTRATSHGQTARPLI